jgi:DNA-binding CsgD family transcriptional regulator
MPRLVAPRTEARVPPDDPVAGSDLTPLVRQLIQKARRRGFPAAPVSPADGHAALLDVTVDGVRCVLVEVPVPSTAPPDRGAACLSPREHEIVRMVAKGYPNKTIAAVLDISAWTVGTYLRRIFAKLGVSTRASMVAKLQRSDDGEPLFKHNGSGSLV